MFKASTASQAIRWLRDRLIDRLFTDDDERAKRRGWQVQRTPWGRRYRDSRWDRISICGSCAGEGFLDVRGTLCPVCRGDGSTRTAHTEPGRSREIMR